MELARKRSQDQERRKRSGVNQRSRLRFNIQTSGCQVFFLLAFKTRRLTRSAQSGVLAFLALLKDNELD